MAKRWITRHMWGLRPARRAAGLRQRDLAACIGVPRQRVAEWECGLRATVERIAMVAAVLNVTPADLCKPTKAKKAVAPTAAALEAHP